MALIFALLAPLLVLAGGGAIDVTNASMRQANLQQAVDAAAIGAVARNSPGYQAALQMSSDGTVSAPNEAANAQAIFNANRHASTDTSVTPITVAVSKAGTVVSSTITDTGVFSPSFLGLIGLKTIQLAASSHAADNIPAYMNFYLLLDNTPSQGVAATSAGIQWMVSHTPDQCAFACHDSSANGNDYYTLAKTNGINTRIYNVAQASSNLFATAQNTETANGIPGEFSVSIFDFGTTPSDPTSSTGFTQVYPQQFGATSSDLKSASTAAAAIDVMTVNGQGEYSDEDSNLNAPLNFAAQNLTSSGTGSAATSPQQVLFFVSDGINDTYNCGYSNGNTCRQITPLDPTPCTTLKNHGVKIAVLYTTYLPLPTNSFYNSWVAPYNAPAPPSPTPTQISTAMQTCASPGLYFEVNSSQDINAAMQALFQRVIATVRITS